MMNNENGRSMVEMLGVLAIIGVLSVARIAGYSMAMRKYRANEMLNVASQAVVLAQTADAGMGLSAATGVNVTSASIGMDESAIPTYMGTVTISGNPTDGYTVDFTGGASEPCTTAKNSISGSSAFSVTCSGS